MDMWKSFYVFYGIIFIMIFLSKESYIVEYKVRELGFYKVIW